MSYHIRVSAERSILRANEEKSIELARHGSMAELAVAISDVAYLSREQYLQDWLIDGTEQSRRSLARELLAFADEKARYNQIRLLDEQGVERVRVDRASGRPHIVSRQELQDKSDRYYFTETLPLDRDQVYLSPFDLNVEHGAIEQPLRPTIRIAMPVFDREGRKRGVVVLNYSGQRLLTTIRGLASNSVGRFWLLNSSGYWLIGPSRQVEWAFMYPERQDRSFAHAYPAAWQMMTRSPDGAQFDLEGDLFTYATISPAATERAERTAKAALPGIVSHDSWILLTHVPAGMIAAQLRPAREFFATLFVALVLLQTAVAGVIYRQWTARQTAEQEAKRGQAIFHGLLEATPDATIATDGVGKIVLANTQVQRLLGYQADELIGQPVEILLPERHRAGHVKFGLQCRADPEPRRMGGRSQLWAIRSDGTELPVDVSLNPVELDRESLIFASVRDMTDRYEKEQQIEEMAVRLARDNLELNSLNRELDAFCYSVSHDLRAPLRSMTGFGQALLEDYGDKLDDVGQDYIQRISAASKRMGQLIDDLLMLSRVSRTEVKRVSVDLSELAESVASQLREGDPARTVEFKIQPGVTAQCDETLLRTVMDNLVGNSWKYSARKRQATIEFGVTANGSERTFFVRDNGAGFDMAHADKLFKPFQRLHGSTEFEGTGIGLASVANIIRRHGGRIWAESEPGEGTTMRFTL